MQGGPGVGQLVDQPPDLGTGTAVALAEYRAQHLLNDAGFTLCSHQVHPEVANVESVLCETGRHSGHQESIAVVHHQGPGLSSLQEAKALKLVDGLHLKASRRSQFLTAHADRAEVSNPGLLRKRSTRPDPLLNKVPALGQEGPNHLEGQEVVPLLAQNPSQAGHIGFRKLAVAGCRAPGGQEASRLQKTDLGHRRLRKLRLQSGQDLPDIQDAVRSRDLVSGHVALNPRCRGRTPA